MDRDEYIRTLKARLDQWNAEAAKWEAMGAKQLEQFRAQREAALAELERVQGASADAWKDMMRGADSVFKSMQQAFDKAQREFSKKK
jgi:hypothetical protein